jgi:hypothetical protein
MQSEANVVNADEVTKVKCSNCNKELMFLYEKEKSGNPLFKLKVDCCYCSDTSYLKEIYGVMRFLPADGVQLKDSVDDVSHNGVPVKRFKTGKAK